MKSFGFKRASSKRYPANALPASPSLCHVTPSPSMQTKSGTDECRQTESHNRERRMLAPAKRKQKEARKWSRKEELCERSRVVARNIMSPISWCRCLYQLSSNVLGNFPLQNIPANFPKQLLAPQDAVRMLRVLSLWLSHSVFYSIWQLLSDCQAWGQHRRGCRFSSGATFKRYVCAIVRISEDLSKRQDNKAIERRAN